MTSRGQVRKWLAGILRTELVDERGIAQQVEAYRLPDLAGRSPVVMVLSSGSERLPFTFEGNRSRFYFDVQVWTLYADGEDWTEAEAEDRADALEVAVAEVLEAHRKEALWELVTYDGRTTAEDVVTSGGVPYIVETIPIVVEVFSG